MNTMEKNVMHSFRLAKNDIMKVQSDCIELSQSQERILELIEELKAQTHYLQQQQKVLEVKLNQPSKVVTRVVEKPKVVVKKVPSKPKVIKQVVRAKKTYVAAQDGDKFHISSCPFAQNIKPKNRAKFKTKQAYQNNGYKPCKCVKR